MKNILIINGHPNKDSQLKKSTLGFCGVSPVKVTYIGIIKTADEKKRAHWLQKVALLGEGMK